MSQEANNKMQVVKNMLTSDSNKGIGVKPFFVLLMLFVLVGCGSESSPDAANVSSKSKEAVASPVKTAESEHVRGDATEDPEPDAPNASLISQADVVASIKKLGGRVYLDRSSGEVLQVDLSPTKITDAWLVHLKHLPKLRLLKLYNTQVTDAGLVHLKGLSRLETL
ncbi:MAG: hypothetical protein GY758_34340, partial [Fuerstiella sp.]|nr:hypothetical protein [Fuerstiella sp.]